MRIAEKLAQKQKDNAHHGGVSIAFLGDSVTQGCFEIYKTAEGTVDTVYDQQHSYAAGVWRILSTLYPKCPIHVINAGISGDTAKGGFARLERDVLRYAPDLCVVCYGLNDCSSKPEGKDAYLASLRSILETIKERGTEVIFMTPNRMNTYVSPHIVDPDFRLLAAKTAQKQNDGLFDSYMESARELCRELEVAVCDCYALWKRLFDNGVDTTELLANKINHPTREMNRLFSYELVRCMLS